MISPDTAHVFFQTADWTSKLTGPIISWRGGIHPNGEVWVTCQDPQQQYERAVVWARFVGDCSLSDQLLKLALLIGQVNHYAAVVELFVPYLPFSLQDREAKPGEAAAYDRVAALLAAAGLSKVVVYDTHSERNLQSWPIPVEQRSAMRALADKLLATGADWPHTAVIAPDQGASARAQVLADYLHVPSYTLLKERQGPGAVTVNAQILTGCPAQYLIMVDDMINTGGTLVQAAAAMQSTCHPQQISVVAIHGPLVTGALERLWAAGISKVFTTDSFLLATPTTTGVVTATAAHVIVPIIT